MTAVETLIEHLKDMYHLTPETLHEFEQAKKMQKQEHGKTWDAALDKYEVRAGNYMRAYEDFDDYYEQTFKTT